MPYIGNQPGTGVRSRFIYTATASQTTFSGADDNSKTLKYADSDYIDVYLNGVCLVPGTDYTASTKTSVVLTQAASLSDTLEVVAYDIATISDTVSKADGGQFDGAVTVEADFTVDSNTLHVDSANNKVGILDDAPDGALHVYNGMLQVGSKDGDTSVQQNANAIRIAAVPNTSTEWGGLQWYREFSNYIGAEIIAARASATEADTDLILKTSSTAANASERMRIAHDGNVGIGRAPANSTVLDVEGDSSGSLRGLSIRNGNTGSGAAVSLIFSLNRTGSDVDFTAASITAHKVSSWTTTPSTVDGYLTFSTVNNETTAEKMRLDKDGNLLIGTTASNYPSSTGTTISPVSLTVSRDSGSPMDLNRGQNDGQIVGFRRSSTTVGTISVSSSATAYNTSSDYRLKENVTDVTDGITRVKQLAPKRFNFIVDADKTVDGFLAHEAATVVPEAVTGTKDAMMDEEYEVTAAKGDVYTPATDDADEVVHSNNVEQPDTLEEGQQWRETAEAVMGTRTVPDMQGIDQAKLVPLLTAALQEAIAKIETLETKVAALEAE